MECCEDFGSALSSEILGDTLITDPSPRVELLVRPVEFVTRMLIHLLVTESPLVSNHFQEHIRLGKLLLCSITSFDICESYPHFPINLHTLCT